MRVQGTPCDGHVRDCVSVCVSRKKGIRPEWSWGGIGVVGMGGGSAGCVGAGCHFPRDWFNSTSACLLSKSPAQC